MRKISAWVAIAAVPTMIAGIYGMNFDHMPELQLAARLLRASLVLMVVITAVLYRAFKRVRLAVTAGRRRPGVRSRRGARREQDEDQRAERDPVDDEHEIEWSATHRSSQAIAA